jgi:Kef-type K+ transport system membrane component KefB
MMQIVLMFAMSAGLRRILVHVGQPAVVGDMLVGLILGPMVLGALMPQWQAVLFNADAAAGLRVLSDLGLVLFMFLVGAETGTADWNASGRRAAWLVGAWSLVLPFVLGAAVAPFLFQWAPKGSTLFIFSLFIGAVFSVTAFPVLARMLRGNPLVPEAVKQQALLSAAASDVGVWVMMIVVAVLRDQTSRSWENLVFQLVLIVALVWASKRWLTPVMQRYLQRLGGADDPAFFGLLLCGALTYASITSWLGVHAVFGAFLFGSCLPRSERLQGALSERIQHIVLVAMLPGFFAMAGLHANPDIGSSAGLGMLAIVLATAIVGKLLGGLIGARHAGFAWSDSYLMAVLLNARGMMEIVVLKMGLDLGIIGPELFTAFLLMAVVTTLMANPMVCLLRRGQAGKQ